MAPTSTERPAAFNGDDDRLARAALTFLAAPGDARIHARIRADGAVAAYRSALANTGHQDPAAWRSTRPVRQAHAALQTGTVRLIIPGDPYWPDALNLLGDLDAGTAAILGPHHAPPPALWVRGTMPLTTTLRRAVTIIGARAATSYGHQIATEIAAGCAEQGWTILAGGAFGIEAAAHRAALAVGGTTIAVLAGGLDRPHPAGNAALLDRIGKEGLLVTEAPPGTGADRHRYAVRHRLLATLTAGTVLIEAANGSSAVIALTTAVALGKPAMALPGPVTSAMSVGCHRMLRNPRVRLVTDAHEVLAALQHG